MTEVRIDSAQRFVESSQMGRAIGEIHLQTRSARSNDCSENFWSLVRLPIDTCNPRCSQGCPHQRGAMGLKSEDINYHNKQIGLRWVWVNDRIVEKMKTDDSEAPVPLTDMLGWVLACLAISNGLRATWRLGLR